jgi:hypothetical protein
MAKNQVAMVIVPTAYQRACAKYTWHFYRMCGFATATQMSFFFCFFFMAATDWLLWSLWLLTHATLALLTDVQQLAWLSPTTNAHTSHPFPFDMMHFSPCARPLQQQSQRRWHPARRPRALSHPPTMASLSFTSPFSTCGGSASIGSHCGSVARQQKQ